MGTYITAKVKTNLSDAFFYDPEDNERFDTWFQGQLRAIKFFTFVYTAETFDVPDVSKLYISVNEFDENHNIYLNIRVDDGEQDFDDLADNDLLFDYIEKIIPNVIEQLNVLAERISVPMYEAESFRNLKFDDDEFYSLLGYDKKLGFYPVGRFYNTTFELIDSDVDVYI